MERPTILLVDPDSRSQAVLKGGLQGEGFQVLPVGSGEEALALLDKGERPALVLAEASAPQLEGLCARLKGAGLGPVLLLGQEAGREAGLRHGVDDYLVKPLYLRDVCTLSRLFTRGPGQALTGDLATTPLFFLLRALTAGGRSGTVKLRDGAELRFQEGKLVAALAPGVRGEAALQRLLLLSAGAFTVTFGPVEPEGGLSYTARDLVLRGEPQVKRFERSLAILGGLDAVLVVDFPTLARELERLPDGLNPLIRLFDGLRTLSEVLRESPLDEVTGVEVARRLHELTILREKDQAPKLRLTQVPALFEPREAAPALAGLIPSEPLPAAPPPPTAPPELKQWLNDEQTREEVRELLGEAEEPLVGGVTEEVSVAASRELSTPAGAQALPGAAWSYVPPSPPPFPPRKAAGPTRPAVIINFPPKVPHVPDQEMLRSYLDVPELPKDNTGKWVVGSVLAALALLILTQVWPSSEKSNRLARPAPVAAAPRPVTVPAPEAAAAAPAEAPADPAAAKQEPAPEPETPAEPPKPRVVRALPIELKAEDVLEDIPAQALPAPQAAPAAQKESPARLVAQAMGHLDNRRLAQAEEFAMKALELDPNQANAFLVLGMVYQEQGQPSKARVEYESYLRVAPAGAHAGEVKTILEGLGK